MAKTILYCGFGWSTNIGNAFIDYGVEYSLSQACPEAQVHFVSNMPGWLKYKYGKGLSVFKNKYENSFDLRTLIDADYCILSGALFSTLWFQMNKTFYDYLVNSKIRVVIYGGGGGNDRKPDEKKEIREYLKKLNLHAFISRDHVSFESYADLANSSYDGIDCGFFVNNYFTPAKLNIEDFVIFTFDHINEPVIDCKKKIIRLYHAPWDLGRLESLLKSPIKVRKLMLENDLISDFPLDYLNLYGNCDAVYSDRVHACVGTLAYGGKAQYFGKSPRSFLFERVGLHNIKSNLVEIDQDYLNKEKEKQLNFLAEILS